MMGKYRTSRTSTAAGPGGAGEQGSHYRPEDETCQQDEAGAGGGGFTDDGR